MNNKEDKKVKEPITGVIDPELINIHMKAAREKDSGSATSCLLMKHLDGYLHIVTSDGRILLHTTIPDRFTELDGKPDFEVAVKVTRKLKKGKKEIPNVFFTIDGDKVFFRAYKTFDAFEICEDDYPDFDKVECHDKGKTTEREYRPIAPHLLAIVHDYIGVDTYTHPMKVVGEQEGALYFMRGNGSDTRLAVVMPLRQI